MTHLVAEDSHAPVLGAPFHLVHLAPLQRLEARMRKIKWNRDARVRVRSEELVAQPEVGAKDQALARHLDVKALDVPFEFRSLDAHSKIAQSHVEQLLVAVINPLGFGCPAARGDLSRALPRTEGAGPRDGVAIQVPSG